MAEHRNTSRAIGSLVSGELAWASVLGLLALALLAVPCGRQERAPERNQRVTATPPRSWRDVPEVLLIVLALPLELLWEIAQFPLYTVWHQGDWGYILYGLVHCTLGDLLILLVAYELVALLCRNRRWYAKSVALGGVLFTLGGAAYTVFSEILNVRIKGTWDYTNAMPIVPMLAIGGTPFLQWLLIPPTLLWLMHLVASAGRQTAASPHSDKLVQHRYNRIAPLYELFEAPMEHLALARWRRQLIAHVMGH